MQYAIVLESTKEGDIGRVVAEEEDEVVLNFGNPPWLAYRFRKDEVQMLAPHSVGLFSGVLHTIPYGRISIRELERLVPIDLSAECDGNRRVYLIRQIPTPQAVAA